MQKGVDRSKVSWKKPTHLFRGFSANVRPCVQTRWCGSVCPVHGLVPRACQLQYDEELGLSSRARVCTRKGSCLCPGPPLAILSRDRDGGTAGPGETEKEKARREGRAMTIRAMRRIFNSLRKSSNYVRLRRYVWIRL